MQNPCPQYSLELFIIDVDISISSRLHSALSLANATSETTKTWVDGTFQFVTQQETTQKISLIER